MGKSAVLSAWLARREAAGAVVPHRRRVFAVVHPSRFSRLLRARLHVALAEHTIGLGVQRVPRPRSERLTAPVRRLLPSRALGVRGP
jgi:hypothetical protein